MNKVRAQPLRPVAEAAVGVMAASWGVFGAGIAIIQGVLGPETAVNIGFVVNLGLIIAGALAIFHAGGIFKDWKTTLQSTAAERENNKAVEARLAAVEKILDLVLKHQGITPPEDDEEV